MKANGNGRKTCDAAIVGGGIIGLAIGWRLVGAGLSTIVVERGRAGEGASSAAAGMLAPNAEAGPGDAAFLDLARHGLAMWPDFAGELKECTGTDVELRTDGILMAARSGAEAAGLQDGLEARRRAGAPVEWLDGTAIRKLEPHLPESVAGGLLFAADGQVNNRRATMALARAFVTAGGRLREATPVTGLRLRGGRAAGLETAGGVIEAGTIILAAGAWAGSLPGWPAEALPPVRPVKGQMAALQPHHAVLERVVWGAPGARGIYLVPRLDGRIILGATVEDAGFDTRVTAAALHELLGAATALVPDLADAALTDSWAGLRPGTPDNAPVIGPSPIDGLVWATGHHRNGILLAPLTADAVCRVVTTTEQPDHHEIIRPDRAALTAPPAALMRRQAETM